MISDERLAEFHAFALKHRTQALGGEDQSTIWALLNEPQHEGTPARGYQERLWTEFGDIVTVLAAGQYPGSLTEREAKEILRIWLQRNDYFALPIETDWIALAKATAGFDVEDAPLNNELLTDLLMIARG